jgi:hypothetical protein
MVHSVNRPWVEEREINNGHHVGVGLEDDASNPSLEDMHEQWFREDQGLGDFGAQPA